MNHEQNLDDALGVGPMRACLAWAANARRGVRLRHRIWLTFRGRTHMIPSPFVNDPSDLLAEACFALEDCLYKAYNAFYPTWLQTNPNYDARKEKRALRFATRLVREELRRAIHDPRTWTNVNLILCDLDHSTPGRRQ